MNPPQTPSSRPAQSSIDDKIAQERRARSIYDHQNQANRQTPLYGLLAVLRYDKRFAITVIGCLLLITGGAAVAAIIPLQFNQTPQAAVETKDQTDEIAIETEAVYGLSSEEMALIDAMTGHTSSSASPGSSGSPLSTDGAAEGHYGHNDQVDSPPDSDSNPYSPLPPLDSPSQPKPPTPTEPRPPKTVSASVNIVSWNYAHWKPVANMVSGVKTLSKNVDIIGFQEFGPKNKREALKKLVRRCNSCGYALYMPSIERGGNVPIVWKKDKFRLLATGNLKVYDAQIVEDGAGGRKATAKHITWVRLKERVTGRVFYHLNTHLIPTATPGGKPSKTKPKRAALYKKHVDRLSDKARAFRAAGNIVTITGDFNINYPKDKAAKVSSMPYMKLGRVGIWANWRYLGTSIGGTHGNNSYIDYVYLSRSSVVVSKSHKVLPKYGSDHNALRMTVLFKK